MRIQHNIPAMNAYRNYNSNVKSLQSNLQKLSSGYRINKAGDDAAGLAISEKMRAQITGLEVAQKNAKDGISLVQTAEGAMTEVHDMLNRMYELAEQSANGTYADEVDREQMQKEIESLRTEINRIADSTNFNGLNLMDGSLESGLSKSVDGEKIDVSILSNEVEPAQVGTGTVLHKDGVNEAKTIMQADLHNLSFDVVEGSQIDFKIGNDTITLTGVAAGAGVAADGTIDAGTTLTGKDLADAIKAAFEGTNSSLINGQKFNATTTADGQIKFEQDAAPADSTQVVQANQAVTVTFTAGATTAAAAGTAKTDAAVNWADAAAGTSAGTEISTLANIDTTNSKYVGEDKVLAFVNSQQILPTGSAGDDQEITLKTLAAGDGSIVAGDTTLIGKLGIMVGDQVIGVAVDGNGDPLAFAATDGAGTAVDYNFVAIDSSKAIMTDADGKTVDLGKLTIQDSNAGTAINANSFNAAKKVGKAIALGVGATDAKTVDFSAADTGKLATAADTAGAKADGDIVMKSDGTNVALYVGSTKISNDVAFTAGTFTFQDTTGTDNLLTVDTTGLAIGDITGEVKTGLTFTAAASGTNSGSYNVETTMNVQGTEEKAAQLASTKFDLTSDIVQDGNKLTIGENVYVFKVGSESKVTPGTGETLIDLSAMEAGDTNLINKAGELLSDQSDANAVFSIGNMGGGKISIHEKVGNAKFADELSTVSGFDSLIFANKAGKQISGKPLTLQIGDTSESFNKIAVDIKDMHADAMGIGSKDVDISTQDGASKAMDAIKSAINYVSDVRGDLGATQNRLDHTINNLSVAQENIQDAESTIRDVDVAEEMMAYTKNNILVQAAQAMLAQANQLPQGVLQLLG